MKASERSVRLVALGGALHQTASALIQLDVAYKGSWRSANARRLEAVRP